MSVEDHQISFSLEINVQKAVDDLRRVQTILYRTLGLLQRMGLPENIDNAVWKLRTMIRIANQARLALRALQAARMATGDPLAWAMFGLSVAELGFSTVDAAVASETR